MKPTSLQRTGDFLQQIRCYLYASILPLCEWADGGVLWLAHVAACHHWCPSCPSSCLCMAWTWGLALSDLPHVPHHCLSQHCFTTELWKPTCFEEQFFFCHFFMKSKKWQGNGLGWWKTSGFAAWKHSSAMCCLYSWGKSVLLLPAFWQPPVLSTMWSTARLYAFIL